jgi:hypothetical protein
MIYSCSRTPPPPPPTHPRTNFKKSFKNKQINKIPNPKVLDWGHAMTVDEPSINLMNIMEILDDDVKLKSYLKIYDLCSYLRFTYELQSSIWQNISTLSR